MKRRDEEHARPTAALTELTKRKATMVAALKELKENPLRPPTPSPELLAAGEVHECKIEMLETRVMELTQKRPHS